MVRPFYQLVGKVAANRKLTGNDKVLHAIIVGRIGDNGFCWAGVRRLAHDAGIDKGTVVECVKRLEDAGVLVAEHRDGKVTHYFVPESVRKTRTVPVSSKGEKRTENPYSSSEGEKGQSVRKTRTEAYGKPVHNRDSKRQKKKARSSAAPAAAQKTREAKAARRELVTVFRESFRERLGRDYSPGSSAAGDNSRLKASFPTAERCPSLVEWKRRIGNLFEHLEAEFAWKTAQGATSEAVREQVAALASVKYLLSSWQRFSVGVATKGPTPDAHDWRAERNSEYLHEAAVAAGGGAA